MDVSNVGAAGGYQYQSKTAKDFKEEVRNMPDSEKKDLGVIVEISKDAPEAQRLSEAVQQRIQSGERGKCTNTAHTSSLSYDMIMNMFKNLPKSDDYFDNGYWQESIQKAMFSVGQ